MNCPISDRFISYSDAKADLVIYFTIGPYYLNKRLRLQPWRLANWLKGSRFKGSEVDFTATLINEIKGKGKKRDGNNPEPGTPWPRPDFTLLNYLDSYLGT